MDPLRRLLGLPARPPRTKHEHPDHPRATAPAGGRPDLHELRRQGWRGVLALLGPGVVTGASDDDPSGIGTFTQAGAQFGYAFLWTALFTLPLMYAVQETCQRIALQTGQGLGVALTKRFPRWVILIAIAAVTLANVITLGADLGAVTAAVRLLSGGFLNPRWVLLPLALALVLVQVLGSYELTFKIFKWLTLALFAYVVAGLISHPRWAQVLLSTVRPELSISPGSVTLLIALFGTTISPYLFIWQASNEVEQMKAAGAVRVSERRGLTNSQLASARLDVGVGMLFSQVIMYFTIITSAAALHAHGHTDVQSASQAAAALGPIGGRAARIVFSLGIIGTGLLAVPILSGATAYGIKEVVPRLPGSLAAPVSLRPTFYAIVVLATAIGTAMNYVGVNVIQALVIASAVNGAVAGPLLILIWMVASDRKIMGRRTLGPLGKFGLGAAALTMCAAAAGWFATMLIAPSSL